MQLKKARAALLSNYEVLSLLNEQQNIQKAQQLENPNIEYPEHLRTIQFELTEYLNNVPCSTQTPAQIKRFLEAFQKYDLTRAERLQILNLRPKSAVEIYLLIEECEERFSEEDLEGMLFHILETLPRDDDVVEEEDVEGEEMDES
ncbi:HRDC-like protein [Radiomyces spectabilis]|uniref:HRDC-like protein n=1 Tax=Radiomyces spectabilis TaxID=64574 RepID=UPI00221F46E6|nr:HRDC-like protein [Radiomyces spectabilis]KAI8371468.1 HRDC-like protein [Radiomyces spectabilis]